MAVTQTVAPLNLGDGNNVMQQIVQKWQIFCDNVFVQRKILKNMATVRKSSLAFSLISVTNKTRHTGVSYLASR
jgi:hypothetical protein